MSEVIGRLRSGEEIFSPYIYVQKAAQLYPLPNKIIQFIHRLHQSSKIKHILLGKRKRPVLCLTIAQSPRSFYQFLIKFNKGGGFLREFLI